MHRASSPSLLNLSTFVVLFGGTLASIALNVILAHNPADPELLANEHLRRTTFANTTQPNVVRITVDYPTIYSESYAEVEAYDWDLWEEYDPQNPPRGVHKALTKMAGEMTNAQLVKHVDATTSFAAVKYRGSTTIGTAYLDAGHYHVPKALFKKVVPKRDHQGLICTGVVLGSALAIWYAPSVRAIFDLVFAEEVDARDGTVSVKFPGWTVSFEGRTGLSFNETPGGQWPTYCRLQTYDASLGLPPETDTRP